MAISLDADELEHIVDRFLHTHPWVRERIALASDDATAARVAQSELRNGGFWAGLWAADGLTDPARGITVTRTPRLGNNAAVLIRWREVAMLVRHGASREQMTLFQ